ncbi:MAG TPA: hypothetical protein VG651_13705 [Stellaceae bacterium]|nr:hypothetical protein [Stellaceae bacterium]
MQVLAFLLARFSEPSSYAGLGAVLALAGWHFSDSDLGQTAQFLAAGCGLAALLLKERGIIPMVALTVMLGGALGACAPLLGAGAALGTVSAGIQAANSVSGTVDTTIRTACAAYDKGRAAANAALAIGTVPADTAGKVAVIEEYGDAACADPPAGDALSTAIWLGTLVGQIAALTAAPGTGVPGTVAPGTGVPGTVAPGTVVTPAT